MDTVPVPAGLGARVRATVARRRMLRFFAAVAAVLLLFLGIMVARPAPKPPPEIVVVGPRIALTDPVPPLHVRDAGLATRVTASEDGISIRFEGARDE